MTVFVECLDGRLDVARWLDGSPAANHSSISGRYSPVIAASICGIESVRTISE